jgi:hypothetical protein
VVDNCLLLFNKILGMLDFNKNLMSESKLVFNKILGILDFVKNLTSESKLVANKLKR